MLNRKIIFTKPLTAELVDTTFDESAPLTGSKALVKTLFTAVSAGTERDNLRGEPNLSCLNAQAVTRFPIQLGYSGVGIVVAAGPDCRRVKPGDRVIVCFGTHSEYNLMDEASLYPVMEGFGDKEAALAVISCFPAEGVRKTRLEFGESALIMGLGILGLFAVQIARAAGASPVIAADPDPERRELALKLGASYALDPLDEGFVGKVTELCCGGADIAVDAVGNAAATSEALACLKRFGRLTLVGCTRHHGEYDMYHLVHGKGVSIIGANNVARPVYESRPGNWTMGDDIAAMQKLSLDGRIDFGALISEVHSPTDAPSVYTRLGEGKKFPIGVLFDWSQL